MNAIDFSVTPPVFKRSCEGDNLCWVLCPEDAVEMINSETTSAGTATQQTTPHDHPFLKLLAEAEAKGRFRRLVPIDKIGWDTPIYKNPNHPRVVVEEE